MERNGKGVLMIFQTVCKEMIDSLRVAKENGSEGEDESLRI